MNNDLIKIENIDLKEDCENSPLHPVDSINHPLSKCVSSLNVNDSNDSIIDIIEIELEKRNKFN